MTTSSARPDLLRLYAEHSRTNAGSGDDAITAVASASSACRDRCPELPLPSAAITLAALGTDEVTALARAVTQVAEAFEAADANPAPKGVRRPGDLTLARTIADRSAGLATGVLVAPLEHERGRLLGRRLRRAAPGQAAQMLEHLEMTGVDPEVAAGVLDGLGANGLATLVHRLDQAAGGHGLSLTARRVATGRLGALLARAATTVAPMHAPGVLAPVSPGGLDLRLVRRLGATRDGRRALRAMVGGVEEVPGPVAMSLAEALLFGPTPIDDHLADGGRSPLLTRADDGAEAQVMALLSASPAAAYQLESNHMATTSPVLTMLARADSRNELAAAGTVVDAVVNVSVDNGWSRPWHPPVTGEVAAQEAQPVPRVLAGLVRASIDADRRIPAPATLSRALASAVDHHLDFFAAELHAHAEATHDAGVQEVEPMTATARFFEAISRDLPALERVAAAVRRPDLDGIDKVLADHPPGRLGAAEIYDVLTRERPLVDELRHGADAAGRHDRLAVLLALKLGTKVLPGAVSAAGKAGGPWGAVAATAVSRAVPAAGRAGQDQWGHTDDDREDMVVHASPYRAAHRIAVAMAEDPDWHQALTFTPAVSDPGALQRLDPVRSPGDRRRFDQWLARQDPVVSEAIEPLVRP